MPNNSKQVQLHTCLFNVIDEIRSRLGNTDIWYFDFQITVSGRTLGTDLYKIEYQLGDRYSNDSAVGAVVGGTLSAVIDEYLRRVGWQEQNNPVAISPPAINPDGVIPF